jgi:hypothetical protein
VAEQRVKLQQLNLAEKIHLRGLGFQRTFANIHEGEGVPLTLRDELPEEWVRAIVL